MGNTAQTFMLLFVDISQIYPNSPRISDDITLYTKASVSSRQMMASLMFNFFPGAYSNLANMTKMPHNY